MSESLAQKVRTLRALYWSPRDPEGRGFASLAEAYRQKGDLDEADALVRDGVGRLPDFATGHLVAARVARERADAERAERHLESVLELDPENVVALVERAGHRIGGGDREGAAQDLEAVLRLEPDHPEALERLRELDDLGPTSDLDPAISPSHALDDEQAGQVEVEGDQFGEESFDLAGLDVTTTEPESEADPDLEGEASPSSDELGIHFELPDEPAEEPADAEAEWGVVGSSEGSIEVDSALEEVGPDLEEGALDREVDPVLERSDAGFALDAEGAPNPGSHPQAPSDPDAEVEPAVAPDHALFTRTMGDLYARQGLTDRAIEVFEHLIEQDPDNPSLAARLEELRGAQPEVASWTEDLEEPAADGPALGELVVEESSMEGSAVEEAAAEAPAADDLSIEEFAVEDVAVHEPAVEAPVVDESIVEDPALGADFDPDVTVPAPSPSEAALSESEPDFSLPKTADPASEGPIDEGLDGVAGRTIATYLGDLLAWQPGAVPIESLAPSDTADTDTSSGTEPDAQDARGSGKPAAAVESDGFGESQEPQKPDEALDEFNAWLDGFGE